jgi:PAS domain S-box-containing protein
MWPLPAGIFDTDGFDPLWQSGAAWQAQPFWGWLHIASDVAMWGAYTAIPIVLWHLVRNRRDLPFPRVFWLFGAFIFVCGTGHFIESLMFWWPAYKLSAVMKLVTALVSWAAVYALLPVVPAVLSLRSPRQAESDVQARTKELRSLTERLQAEVAARRRVEQSLRDSEERLRLAIAAGRMGTWDWNLKTGLTRWDERERELFGMMDAGNEADTDAIFARMHPEDRESVRDACERAIESGETYDHEFRVVHPDGRVRWLAGRGDVVRDPAGKPLRMVGVNFDITERRDADDRLRLIDRALDSATNGIVICDARARDLPIIYVNQGFESLTGFSGDDVLGRNCRFLQGPRSDSEAVGAMHRAVAAGEECHVTILNYRKDGTPFWNELRITPLRNDAGIVTHFVGVQADVTDRTEFEESLRRAEARAQAASQAKSEFLANMSHEIRTPLTAVLGCADTLYPRLDSEDHRSMVQMIRNQGQLLLGILNDILDLSKIEAGRLEIRAEPCSIVAVIEEVRSLLQPQAIEKGLEFATEYASPMPVEMHTDPLRVRQVLVNLVGNAIKFTEEGRITIVACCDVEPETRQLVINVRDTGVGISEDKLEAIFEAFAQENPQLSRRVGGTGLGLTISQRLLAMLGGTIRVASRVNQGTTFTVTLPLTEADCRRLQSAGDLQQDSLEQQRSRDSIDVVLPISVLVAEDTRGIQFMIRRMLEDAGATVAVVDNGERAIAEIRRAEAQGMPFDAVLMDMQMPVLNGFDATLRLRAEGCRLPVIALTAAAMQGDREKCLQAGCDDYLSKPIDRRTLLDVLARRYNAHQNNSNQS